jgi:N-methylhydantoinase A
MSNESRDTLLAGGASKIGIDVGGTHTDLCLASPDGIHRAKVLTDHEDYSRGILEAIDVAARDRGLDQRSLLAATSSIVIGTTIVTNSITEHRGARVGIITTRGFRDSFRLLGGARQNVYDDHLQVNPPDLTDRSLITEVDERIFRDGKVLVPLVESDARLAAQQLRDRGADVVSICLLWSFMSDAHERRVAEIVDEEWPGVFVSRSSEVHPVIREYERFSTAVLNAFCQPPVELLLTRIELALAAAGFEGRLSLVSGAGGAIGVETARRLPIMLLGSGPAAGVTAAAAVAEAVHEVNVIVGDMGGTSFDTCVVRDGVPSISSRVRLGPIETGLRLVEVISIGTGGGSIASLDDRGVPQIGPHSAGSMPGPACYGQGGTEPTVTDAAVVLGLIDPSDYLGGRMELVSAAAEGAIARTFPSSLGWEVSHVAQGILELTATNMAHALRSVTVERGHDPREFLMVGYGGMLPLFITQICDKLGVDRALVPRHSSAFSALGTILSDYVRRYSLTVSWDMRDTASFADVQTRRDELERHAREDAAREGVRDAEMTFGWGAECRFTGQVYEVEMPLAAERFDEESASRLSAAFRDHYESLYGRGTAWPEASVTLLNLTLSVRAARDKPTLPRYEGIAVQDLPPALERWIRLPGQQQALAVPVYREADLGPGATLVGPAIVNQVDSTLLVGVGWRAQRDELLNFLLSRDYVVREGTIE